MTIPAIEHLKTRAENAGWMAGCYGRLAEDPFIPGGEVERAAYLDASEMYAAIEKRMLDAAYELDEQGVLPLPRVVPVAAGVSRVFVA